MSNLNLLANFAAAWRPDPEQRERCLSFMRDKLRLAAVQALPNGWIVGIQPLPRTSTDHVLCTANRLVILQAPASMRTGPDRRLEAASLADIARNRPLGLGEYPGDCALVTLDDHGEYHLVASPGSLPPLYYSRDGDTVTLASRLDWIAAMRPAPIAMDRLAAALWANLTPLYLDGRTVIEGVRRIRRGTHRQADASQPGFETDLTTRFLGKAGADCAATKFEVAGALHDAVLKAMDVELTSDGLNLLSLSGGTDSSTLAILARLLGKPFKAVSLMPTELARREHELSYIREALGERYPNEWLEIPWPHKEYWAEVMREAPDILHPVMHPVLCKLGAIRNAHAVATYFGGEFCDELIGGISVFTEWCASRSPATAWKHTPIRMAGRTLTFRHYLAERARAALTHRPAGAPRRLPDYFDASVRDEYSSWLRLQSGRGAVGPLARWYGLYSPLVDMNWEASSHYGVRRSFPFAGRHVLSLLNRTSADLRLGPRHKELFRLAFRSEVPPGILDRGEKGSWGGHLRLGPGGHVPGVTRLMTPPGSGILRASHFSAFSVGIPERAVVMVERMVSHLNLQGEKMISEKKDSSFELGKTDEIQVEAPYDAPRITPGGNVSSVTKGATGAGTDGGVASL